MVKFSTKVAKQRAKKIGGWINKHVKEYQAYEAKAPSRRKAEIFRLQQTIKTEKLKSQLRKVRESNRPKDNWGI